MPSTEVPGSTPSREERSASSMPRIRVPGNPVDVRSVHDDVHSQPRQEHDEPKFGAQLYAESASSCAFCGELGIGDHTLIKKGPYLAISSAGSPGPAV